MTREKRCAIIKVRLLRDCGFPIDGGKGSVDEHSVVSFTIAGTAFDTNLRLKMAKPCKLL